jgi:hypothetical protein
MSPKRMEGGFVEPEDPLPTDPDSPIPDAVPNVAAHQETPSSEMTIRG